MMAGIGGTEEVQACGKELVTTREVEGDEGPGDRGTEGDD